ncbi:MAG: hypothetical protein LBN98_06060, partial [Prevotellaceae bacterium]|nr:hypothetical protein [Prevotellaceae bacterium]
GVTPKLRINAVTGYWQVCVTGACNVTADEGWTDVPGSDGQPVKATGNDGQHGSTGPQGDAIFAENGVDNSHPDYVVFTLANAGGTITLPRYKTIGIDFAQPEKFDAGDVQTLPHTLTGSVEHVKVISVTPDWTVAHVKTGNAGTFTITAPATFTPDNEAGEAVLLISDGAERTLVRTIALVRIDYVSTDVDAIIAVPAGGDYPVLLASNTSWTAAVSEEGAGWCTVTPTAGTGRSALTVTLAELATGAPDRSATVTVTAGTLTQTVAVTQTLTATPTYAASAQTWTFGASTLVWSDAIQMPECNKDAYPNDHIYPQCRSYTSGTNTWYYYNWLYVEANKSAMCPSPWRVPAKDDMDALIGATNGADLGTAWGYSGFAGASGSMADIGTHSFYWSSTDNNSATQAYCMYFITTGAHVYYTAKYHGLQLRCVR